MTSERQPLIIFVDPAGGEPPARIVRRVAESLTRSGVSPERIGLWPNGDSRDWCSMPAEDIRAMLEDLLRAVPPEGVSQR